MNRLFTNSQWLIPWLFGLACIAVLANPANADYVSPTIGVIHFRQPSYVVRPPSFGSFSKADKADKADIAEALELAKLGDAETQANLGIMLQSRGEYQKAAYWYRQAADAGNAVAEYNLGTLYFNGEGFPRNYTEAHKWFLEAAQRNSTYAEFQLGISYYTGQGVDRDPAKEIFWYQRAARQGLPAAAYNLGVIYNNGKEVPTDYVRAYAWLLVAQKGGLDTNDALSAVTPMLSPDQLGQAKRLGRALAAAESMPTTGQ